MMRVRQAIVVSIATSAALLLLQGCGSGGQSTTTTTTWAPESWGTAGDYDLNIYARFWRGEPADETPCDAYGASHLTIHGIWPQYVNKSKDGHLWPQLCNTSDFVASVHPAVASSFHSKWQQYAPSYPKVNGKKYHDLAQHEWEKHGTCWSASVNSIAPGNASAVESLQTEFFNKSLELDNKYPTPPALLDAYGANKTIALADLQNAFGGAEYVALQCFGPGHSLSMVILCFSKALNQKIKCPASVLDEYYANSCQEDNITNVVVALPCVRNQTTAFRSIDGFIESSKAEMVAV